ncbi:Pentatricopeptide repeat-containing protein, partial [Clarias magur]
TCPSWAEELGFRPSQTDQTALCVHSNAMEMDRKKNSNITYTMLQLLYTHSVLLNTSVPFSCRINAGTGITYLWDFGDGTQRVGQDTEHHAYNRTGEFVVEVTVSNLVSSGSLKGHVFVVLEPCQPPPVKNMGPSKIQIWRYQPVTLGVTYEGQIQCNISKGLQYSWTLYGLTRLPLLTRSIKTNEQQLELPEYFLYYGTYKAVAKVQVVGSIVYSSYTVLLEVSPSAPVSIISGGTNVIINHHNNLSITVDGRRSYDPDFPDNIMSILHVYCKECRGNSVNWNERFSVTAACERCPTNVIYSWKLYLVNSSSKSIPAAEMGSGDVNEMDVDLFHLPVATKDKNTQAKDFAAEYPDEHRYLDYEEFYSGIEEADSGVSVGRPAGPHSLDDMISYSSEYDGDNLVGPGSPGQVVTEKTLMDLHRELIQPALFESFTSTGISSSVITFKPMMLKPKSLYLLEVSA